MKQRNKLKQEIKILLNKISKLEKSLGEQRIDLLDKAAKIVESDKTPIVTSSYRQTYNDQIDKVAQQIRNL